MTRPWLTATGLAAVVGTAVAAVVTLRSTPAFRAELVFEKVYGSSAGQLVFTPDGRRLLVVGYDGVIEVLDSGSGAVLRRFVAGRWGIGTNPFALGADGRHLALAGDAARVWDLETDAEPVTIEGGGAVRAVALTPSGDRLVTSGEDHRLMEWDLGTGATVWEESLPDWGSSLAVPRGGDWIAVGGYRMPVTLRDLRDGRVLRGLSGPSRDTLSLATRPDGARLVGAEGDDQLCEWDAGTGRLLRERRIPNVVMAGLGFDAAGDELLVCEPRAVSVLAARSWRVLLRIPLEHEETTVVGGALSADGTMVATATTTLRVWRLRPIPPAILR